MSSKSTAEKLRIMPGTTVWASHPDRLDLIGPLPQGVRVADKPAGGTTALMFADDGDSLRKLVDRHAGRLAELETLWVAYPKGDRADINRDSLWPVVAEHGVRPVSQISIDEVWSAIRFRPLKPGEPQFTGGTDRG
jgi:hypothetical protein